MPTRLPLTGAVVAPQAEKRGGGRGGQTDHNRSGTSDPWEAAENWRFARAEEEDVILGLGIKR